MTRVTFGTLLAGVFAAVVASSSGSLAEPPNFDPKATAPMTGDIDTLERMATIRELIHLGLQDNDPVLLATAAQLMRRLPTTSITRAKKLGSTDPGDKLDTAQVIEFSVGGILKRAERFAAHKPIAMALISEVRRMPKARPGGGTMYLYKVAANSADEFEIVFEPDHRAAVFAESQDEKGSLGITVLDEGDNVVCQRNRQRPHVNCTWIPIRKGTFKFKIENPLDHPQDYVLVTN